MRKVVYILGAGFSAPLGLPIMRDFLSQSRDVFETDPQRYAHFKQVFDSIRHMSVAKNYYSTDLFNIEEILSLLEMTRFTTPQTDQPPFITYIKDTIQALTPTMDVNTATFPSNWHHGAFGTNRAWTGYGYFVCNMLGISLGQTIHKGGSFWGTSEVERRANYSILTLNYDCVLERVVTFLRTHWRLPAHIGFRVYPHAPGTVSDGLLLAKLHGSVDTDVIVPPTWNKGAYPTIVPAWSKALEALNQATHIRILGYSLPATDSYIRYLLAAGAFDAPNLKAIDVICWDPNGGVRSRFESFVNFQDFRFHSAKTQDYFRHFMDVMLPRGNPSPDWHSCLERAHDSFMETFGKDGTSGG